MRIALLEDDKHQSDVMRVWLEAAGHEIQAFYDGASFREGMPEGDFDLAIMDWILPDTSGIDLLEWLRKELNWTAPAIFVTQRDEERDIVEALQKGADDYMIKPIRPLEMLARITAVTRRIPAPRETSDVLEFGEFRITPSSRRIERNGEMLELTHKEFDLTLFLFRNLGRLLSRSSILENVWGTKADLNTRTVDTHVSRIRNKLELHPDQGWKLSAVYQHGYRLERLDASSEAAG